MFFYIIRISMRALVRRSEVEGRAYTLQTIISMTCKFWLNGAEFPIKVVQRFWNNGTSFTDERCAFFIL